MSEELLHNREETPPCHLELGDIIQVFSPDNDHYHEQVYFISYIDESHGPLGSTAGKTN